MSWISINEQGVPVNDDRYNNRFNLCDELLNLRTVKMMNSYRKIDRRKL